MKKTLQLGLLFILCLAGCVLPNVSEPNSQVKSSGFKPNAKLQRRAQDLQLACFNSPLQEGSIPQGELNTNLEQVLGQSLTGSSLVINGVKLANLNGAYSQNANFDPKGSLDASLTYVELEDKDAHTALPCVAGILSVENTGRQKSLIAKDSSLCFSSFGDSPYLFSSDQQILFGDKSSASSFALTLPGIRKGSQSDGLQLSVVGQEACIRFESEHELAPKGELGELASVFFTLCRVADRKEIAADFINNPKVVSFLNADIRDSLINFNQGNKANIFLSGKRARETYNIFLDGKGLPLAQIETGLEGQYGGGLNLMTAKRGDFLRFVAFDHYFDVPIEDKCAE